MTYVVIGAGAVGSVVAAHLDDVALLARGARLEALRRDGLVVKTPRGPVHRDVPLDHAWRDGDVACIATKTNDVARIVDELAATGRDLAIACFTNGLAAERIARTRFARVYGVCVYAPCTHLGADEIVAHGVPVAGIFDVGPRDATSIALAEAMERGGLWSRAIDDIERWKRAKLAYNATNAVDALCGIGTRDSALARALRAEALAVFAAANLPLVTVEEERARFGTLTTHQKTTGGSTWQSLARGSSIETRYLNGEIVDLGARVSVATPLNRAILEIVEAAAAAHEPPGTRSLAELEREVFQLAPGRPS